ncbi:MAG: hypothetical protein KJ043_12380 [Anaerolineae bacterium]|nr:hypothetical protein [Anaerolineae bacterium]
MLKKIDIQKTPLTLEELLAQLSPDDEIMLLRDDTPLARVLSSTTPQSDTSSQVSDAPEGSFAHALQILNEMDDDDDYLERQNPQVRDIYLRAYEEARAYWRSVGDTEKANMTDEQMDREFWSFDEDGIPRLKYERPAHKRMSDLELALMRIQAEGGIIGGNSIDPEKIDDILNEEFADYLIQRMNRNNDE